MIAYLKMGFIVAALNVHPEEEGYDSRIFVIMDILLWPIAGIAMLVGFVYYLLKGDLDGIAK